MAGDVYAIPAWPAPLLLRAGHIPIPRYARVAPDARAMRHT